MSRFYKPPTSPSKDWKTFEEIVKSNGDKLIQKPGLETGPKPGTVDFSQPSFAIKDGTVIAEAHKGYLALLEPRTPLAFAFRPFGIPKITFF